MEEFTNFTIRCNKEEREAIARLAKIERRKAGDAVRQLVRRAIEAHDAAEAIQHSGSSSKQTRSEAAILAEGASDREQSASDFAA